MYVFCFRVVIQKLQNYIYFIDLNLVIQLYLELTKFVEFLFQVVYVLLKFGVFVIKGRKERMDIGTVSYSCVFGCNIFEIYIKVCVILGCFVQFLIISWIVIVCFQKNFLGYIFVRI